MGRASAATAISGVSGNGCTRARETTSRVHCEVETPTLQSGDVAHEVFSLYAVNHRKVGETQLRINHSTLGTAEMPLPAVPDSGIRVNNFVGHTLYGGCEYFAGQISEIILYSRTLTPNEVTAVETYLDSHWSVSAQDTPAP